MRSICQKGAGILPRTAGEGDLHGTDGQPIANLSQWQPAAHVLGFVGTTERTNDSGVHLQEIAGKDGIECFLDGKSKVWVDGV